MSYKGENGWELGMCLPYLNVFIDKDTALDVLEWEDEGDMNYGDTVYPADEWVAPKKIVLPKGYAL